MQTPLDMKTQLEKNSNPQSPIPNPQAPAAPLLMMAASSYSSSSNTPNAVAPVPASAIMAAPAPSPTPSLSVSSSSSSSSTSHDQAIQTQQNQLDGIIDSVRGNRCSHRYDMLRPITWGGKRFIELCEALEKNSCVTRLVLGYAGKESFPIIKNMLSKNNGIKELVIRFYCGPDEWELIIEGIAQSQSIKTVECIENPSFIESGGPALFDRLILSRPQNSIKLITEKEVVPEKAEKKVDWMSVWLKRDLPKKLPSLRYATFLGQPDPRDEALKKLSPLK